MENEATQTDMKILQVYACPLAAVTLQWEVQTASGGPLARLATLYTSSILISGDWALQPLIPVTVWNTVAALVACMPSYDAHTLQEPGMHITCVLCVLLLWSLTPAVRCFAHVSVVPAQISLVKSCLAVSHGLDMDQYLQSLWGQWDTVAEWLPQLNTCNKTELVKVGLWIQLARMMQLHLE